MTLAEILEELPKLTPAERLTIIEAALELIRKELPPGTAASNVSGTAESAGKKKTLRFLGRAGGRSLAQDIQSIYRLGAGERMQQWAS